MAKDKKDKIEQVKEYINKNIWKRFFKYKLMEIGIIPLSILTIWKLPSWIGWGIIKLFKIDYLHYFLFCKDLNIDTTKIICDGVNYNPLGIWLLGFFVLFCFASLILINWYYVKAKLEEEAEDKFNINSFNL